MPRSPRVSRSSQRPVTSVLTRAVDWWAACQSLIVTGATAVDDARMPFSNYGRCLDLFAPGRGVLSAYAGSDEDRATLSGTSMASAHIAGAAALVLQHSPEVSPAQVAGAIIGSATAGVIRKAGPASRTGSCTPRPRRDRAAHDLCGGTGLRDARFENGPAIPRRSRFVRTAS